LHDALRDSLLAGMRFFSRDAMQAYPAASRTSMEETAAAP
jgi:hypothetical protein